MHELVRRMGLVTALAVVMPIVGTACREGDPDEETRLSEQDAATTTLEADGLFYLATEVERPRFVVGEVSEVLVDPPRRVLDAACLNYADWLADRTLDANVVLLDQARLIRSAELLAGTYADDPIATLAEEVYVQNGESESEALQQLAANDLDDTELAHARGYLRDRSTQPSPDAIERFITYAANITHTLVLVVRAEAPASVPVVDRPALDRINVISVQLNDDRVVGINEEDCWR